jgi:hypothetical protein
MGGRWPVAPTRRAAPLARCLTTTCRRQISSVVGAIVVFIAVECRIGFSAEDKTGESRKQEDLGDGRHINSPKLEIRCSDPLSVSLRERFFYAPRNPYTVTNRAQLPDCKIAEADDVLIRIFCRLFVNIRKRGPGQSAKSLSG